MEKKQFPGRGKSLAALQRDVDRPQLVNKPRAPIPKPK